VGVSRFDALINPPVALPTTGGDASFLLDGGGPTRAVPQHGATANDLTVITTSTELAQASGARRPLWATGLQLTHYQQGFSGQYPRPYPVAVLPDTLFLYKTLMVPAFWAERR